MNIARTIACTSTLPLASSGVYQGLAVNEQGQLGNAKGAPQVSRNAKRPEIIRRKTESLALGTPRLSRILRIFRTLWRFRSRIIHGILRLAPRILSCPLGLFRNSFSLLFRIICPFTGLSFNSARDVLQLAFNKILVHRISPLTGIVRTTIYHDDARRISS